MRLGLGLEYGGPISPGSHAVLTPVTWKFYDTGDTATIRITEIKSQNYN